MFDGDPERTARGSTDITGAHGVLVRTDRELGALAIAAEEVGGDREPLQVLEADGLVAVRLGQQGVGVSPGLAVERLPASLERGAWLSRARGHRPSLDH